MGVLDKGVSEAAMEEVSQEEDLERKCLAAWGPAACPHDDSDGHMSTHTRPVTRQTFLIYF